MHYESKLRDKHMHGLVTEIQQLHDISVSDVPDVHHAFKTTHLLHLSLCVCVCDICIMLITYDLLHMNRHRASVAIDMHVVHELLL